MFFSLLKKLLIHSIILFLLFFILLVFLLYICPLSYFFPISYFLVLSHLELVQEQIRNKQKKKAPFSQ